MNKLNPLLAANTERKYMLFSTHLKTTPNLTHPPPTVGGFACYVVSCLHEMKICSNMLLLFLLPPTHTSDHRSGNNNPKKCGGCWCWYWWVILSRWNYAVRELILNTLHFCEAGGDWNFGDHLIACLLK